MVSGYLSKKYTDDSRISSCKLLIIYVLYRLFESLYVFFKYKNASLFVDFFFPNCAIWYILALFFWRCTLPTFKKIKHIMLFTFLLNIFGFVFSLNGSCENIVQRIVGFMFYFYVGLYINEHGIEHHLKSNRTLSLFVVVVEMISFCIVLYVYPDFCEDAMNIFRHRKIYGNIAINVGVYLMSLIISLANSYFVCGVIKGKNGTLLCKIGSDTLPLYVSHIFVYQYLAPYGNSLGTSIFTLALCLITIYVFFAIS